MTEQHQHGVSVVIGVGGMGVEIARRLQGRGPLVIADYSAEALTAAEDALRLAAPTAAPVTTARVDVGDQESMAALATTAAALGPVTRVVHTAGLSPMQAPTEAVLRVDLVGVALMVQEFGRVIDRGGSGVVIASMAGHMPFGAPTPEQELALARTPAAELMALDFLGPQQVPNSQTAYGIAKRANSLRVQAGALTWGKRGARLNAVSPGVIDTPMGQEELAGESAKQVQDLIDLSPVGRIGTPADIADAVEFLLSERAAFITGADLLVDGGAIAAVTDLFAPAG